MGEISTETSTRDMDGTTSKMEHEEVSPNSSASEGRINDIAPGAGSDRPGAVPSDATLPDTTIPAAVPTTEPILPFDNTPSPSPLPLPQDGLRLCMKVWTDPGTHRRYLMPVAFIRDAVNGQLNAHAMRDDDTRTVLLSVSEWNALPFFYFQEDGYAARAV